MTLLVSGTSAWDAMNQVEEILAAGYIVGSVTQAEERGRWWVVVQKA